MRWFLKTSHFEKLCCTLGMNQAGTLDNIQFLLLIMAMLLVANAQQFQQAIYTSPDQKLKVNWQIVPSSKSLMMEVTCECTGWISIGPSSHAEMSNSDAWIMWVDDATGRASIVDMWMPDYLIPRSDITIGGSDSDLKILQATQINGVTHVIFTRDLYNFDVTSDFTIPIDKPCYYLWAYQDTDDDYSTAHTPEACGAFSADVYTSINSINMTRSNNVVLVSGASDALIALTGPFDSGRSLLCIILLALATYFLSTCVIRILSLGGMYALYCCPCCAKTTTLNTMETAETRLSMALATSNRNPALAKKVRASLRLAEGVDAEAAGESKAAIDIDVASARTTKSAKSRVTTAAVSGSRSGKVSTSDAAGLAGSWETYYTVEGTPYYFNTATEVSQWEVPAELYPISFRLSRPALNSKSHLLRGSTGVIMEEGEGESDIRSPLSPSRRGVMSAARPPSARWEEHLSSSGLSYWWNPETDESVWEKPPAAVVVPSSTSQRIIKSMRLAGALAEASNSGGSSKSSRKKVAGSTTLNCSSTVDTSSIAFEADNYYIGSQVVQRSRSIPEPIDASGLTFAERDVLEHQRCCRLRPSSCHPHCPVRETLLLLLYIMVNIACLAINPLKQSISVQVGYLCGPNALLTAIPATRNSFIVWLFNVPFEKAVAWHQWQGRWTVLLTTVHMGLSMYDWSKANASILGELIYGSKYVIGFIAWCCGIVILVMSLECVRRNSYMVFTMFHGLFVAFYALSALHSKYMQLYAYLSLLFYLVDRLFRIIWGFTPLQTESFEIVHKDIIRIRFRKHWLNELLGRYTPCQHLYVNFPGVHVFEWHPYPISSAPSDDSLEVLVKVFDNKTIKLIEHAKLFTATTVRIEGPYGSFEMARNYHQYDQLVLIGDGISASSLVGLVGEIFRVGDHSPDARRFRPALPTSLTRVHFIWIVRNRHLASIFTHRLLQARLIAERHERMPALNIHIYVTQDVGFPHGWEEAANEFCRIGHPDIERLLTDSIPVSSDVTGVIAYGSPKLLLDAGKVAASRCKHGEAWDFHGEQVFDGSDVAK